MFPPRCLQPLFVTQASLYTYRLQVSHWEAVLAKSKRVQVAAFCFVLTVVTIACGGGQSGGSGNGSGGGGSSAFLTLSYNPQPLDAYPGTTFLLNVTANATGTSASPTISLGTLPTGITTTTIFPLTVPRSGAIVDLEIAPTLSTGSYTIALSGTAGSATARVSIPLTVSSGTPSQAYFVRPLFNEVGLAAGGASSVQVQVLGSSLYELTLKANGLPPGVSATFTPPFVQAGDTFTATLTATSNAPVAQNVQWTITGTPSATVAPSNLALLLDVTSSSGIGWSNRTAYVSTRATPFSAVYDPVHQLIYSSNQTWNRIDVISNATHSLVLSVPVRDPRGLDISIDQKTVWIATGTQVMYGIDTGTFKATKYQLPRFAIPNTPSPTSSWEGWRVLSLSDGTVMLIFSTATGDGSLYAALWDPTANTLNQLPVPSGFGGLAQWDVVTRSGDGKRLFSVGSAAGSFSYDVLTKTLSNVVQQVGGLSVVANFDGSRIAISGGGAFGVYDRSFNLLAQLPGDGGYGGNTGTADGWIFGGAVFSQDGSTLYEETGATIVPVIVSIDVANLQPTALAPAMPVIPVMAELSPSFYLPVPFAVDNSGMVLGIQYHGIAFDDALANVNFVANQPGSPTFLQHMSPYSGPLSGGTTSGGFGNAFSLTPDVYYGPTKGSSTNSQGDVQITSPPASLSGPVDVKILFPDGVEVFDPQFFTYGSYLEDVVLSGGPPQGNVPSTLAAFGLPSDPSQDVVTIGGNRATVTSTQTQYPPFTGEQTATFLKYTVPPGLPGWADVSVTTTNGTGTLAKAFFYANSVNDFATSDSLSFVLYDQSRNQLYLSAGDHVDVFSLTSNSFTAPLQLPSLGPTKQFQGLALTPDKKFLLAADLLDGSLAVIDPDVTSNAFVVNLPQSVSVGTNCSIGPLFVAVDNLGEAIVLIGGVVGTGCVSTGGLYVVNLNSHAITTTLPGCGVSGTVSSSGDGSVVAFGSPFQLYSTAQNRCLPQLGGYQQQGVAAAADGNVFATLRAFVDANANMQGRMGTPPIFYPGRNSAVYYNYSPYQDGALQNPALNDAGSLYFWSYPQYIDIVDVQHGLPRLRFSLAETVSNVVSPMAIDSGGQHIYLITSAGVTIVDLGQAPVSIGHLSQTVSTVGGQVQVRGSGFESGITVTVGGQIAAVTYADPQTLTMIVPPVTPGLQDLKLTNPDGTTYTLENALTVQ